MFTLTTIKDVWSKIAKHQSGNIPLDFEITVYKKMLDLFHVGDYYYYIFNTAHANIEYTSESFEKVTGFTPQVFSVEWVIQNIHPIDQPRFFNYEKMVTDFFNKLPPEKVLKYKVSYDYRIKTKEGKYKWILQQVTTIQAKEDGAVIRVIGIHTDITHIKTDQKPSGLSFLGLDNEPSYLNYQEESLNTNSVSEKFTSKEKQVLNLVVQGRTTKEISEILNKSVHTINSHRKNIFQKSRAITVADLVSKSIENNWV